jgi:hypothetical protein
MFAVKSESNLRYLLAAWNFSSKDLL